ncbi:class I SAM-dependent methyltransferase [Undibacterium sp.]|uniref:class I SAM-dependent methyltransferase n=1 Tax=Undibacterium sp. TaxID=1914977 RepID=UPI003750F385
MADNTLLDQIYKDYGRWKQWHHSNVSRSTLSAFKEIQRIRLPSGSKYLEIGFGRGDLLRSAAKLGFSVKGIERNGANFSDLLNDGFDVSCSCIDDTSNNSQDIAVAFDVFEHLSLSELHSMLTSLSRVLKTNGLLLARFPNNASPFGCTNQNGDITHKLALSGASFSQLAQTCGFETLRVSNPAYVWFDGSLLWPLIALPRWLFRRAIEAILMVAYYGKHSNLDLDVIVLLKKKTAIK